jgi:hypothetical protein
MVVALTHRNFSRDAMRAAEMLDVRRRHFAQGRPVPKRRWIIFKPFADFGAQYFIQPRFKTTYFTSFPLIDGDFIGTLMADWKSLPWARTATHRYAGRPNLERAKCR